MKITGGFVKPRRDDGKIPVCDSSIHHDIVNPNLQYETLVILDVFHNWINIPMQCPMKGIDSLFSRDKQNPCNISWLQGVLLEKLLQSSHHNCIKDLRTFTLLDFAEKRM